MAERAGIGEFSGEAEDWDSYMERLENYFVAHDVTTAPKKRATLLSECGAPTYKVIRSLVAPEKPNEVEYAALVKRIQEHFAPRPSIIVQRFKFNTRARQPGESVSTFVAQLRQLSEHCAYGESLEDMLRDRLVCGIADSRIQRSLLAEPQLTFTKAFQLAQTMEAADRNARKLQGESTSLTAVNALVQAQSTANKPCFRCGELQHPATCRFRDSVCNYCKKTGHLARACRSKRRAFSAQQSRATETATHHVTVTEQEDSYSLFNLNGSGHQPFTVTLSVHGEQIQMELDTGAAVSVMSEQTYKTVWNVEKAPPMQPSKVQLQMYTGNTIPVLGVV